MRKTGKDLLRRTQIFHYAQLLTLLLQVESTFNTRMRIGRRMYVGSTQARKAFRIGTCE